MKTVYSIQNFIWHADDPTDMHILLFCRFDEVTNHCSYGHTPIVFPDSPMGTEREPENKFYSLESVVFACT